MNNLISRKWYRNELVEVEDLRGTAFTGEFGSIFFDIEGFDEKGRHMDFDGTAAGYFIRPDGTTVTLTAYAGVNNGKIFCLLQSACYDVPGRFQLSIVNTGANTQRTVVYSCVGTIARSSTDLVAGPSAVSVSTLVTQMQNAVASMPADYTALRASIAEDYSPSETYEVGGFAWNDGRLYKCTTAIPTAESWNAAHWTTASLADEIAESAISAISKRIDNITLPVLRNGSGGNPWNEQAIGTKYVIPIDTRYDEILVEYIGNVPADHYNLCYSLFKGATDGMESYAARTASGVTFVDIATGIDSVNPYWVFKTADFADYDHFMVYLWARDAQNRDLTLRIATEQGNIRITNRHSLAMSDQEINAAEVRTLAENAAHGITDPFRLIHFTDIHADAAAMGRIVAQADAVCPDMDDIICTGDIVADTAREITSWWNPRILTCIGNHDSASYTSGAGYNWTALSMADRDAYYITPFESNWGTISHTAGRSYYYKDYTAKGVRLIVLDVMLYNDNGAEAAAQTTWLASALASARTAGLHVLIAIHAPHGGSEPVPCAFTKYGEITFPVHADCDTPSVVIETVAAAIAAGLHFIGYLVGHTHQDDIWLAAPGQLMYCATCGAVSQTAQWIDQDMHRDIQHDAYNIVTVDTERHLIKLVRGGGANVDKYLRARKALVIDYSTGNIIGG